MYKIQIFKIDVGKDRTWGCKEHGDGTMDRLRQNREDGAGGLEERRRGWRVEEGMECRGALGCRGAKAQEGDSGAGGWKVKRKRTDVGGRRAMGPWMEDCGSLGVFILIM